MRQDFLKTNDCALCYTSIRANTEKPVRYADRRRPEGPSRLKPLPMNDPTANLGDLERPSRGQGQAHASAGRRR